MKVALIGLVALPVVVGLGATITVVALTPTGPASSARGGTTGTPEEAVPSRQQNVEPGRRGTVIEGAKPHLTVINGSSAITLPGAIPAIVSILPRSSGPLPPLSPLAPDSAAPGDPARGPRSVDPGSVELTESENYSGSGFDQPKAPVAPVAPVAPTPLRNPGASVEEPPRVPAAPAIPLGEKPAAPGAAQGQTGRQPLPDPEAGRGNAALGTGKDPGKVIEKRDDRAPDADISNPTKVMKNDGPADRTEDPPTGSDPGRTPTPYTGPVPAPRATSAPSAPNAPSNDAVDPGVPGDPGDAGRSTLR